MTEDFLEGLGMLSGSLEIESLELCKTRAMMLRPDSSGAFEISFKSDRPVILESELSKLDSSLTPRPGLLARCVTMAFAASLSSLLDIIFSNFSRACRDVSPSPPNAEKSSPTNFEMFAMNDLLLGVSNSVGREVLGLGEVKCSGILWSVACGGG